MSTVGELACVYASLALHDDGIQITAEKISTLVKASNIDFESYWSSLFVKLAEKKNIADLISDIGSGGSGGGAAPVAVAASRCGGKGYVPDVIQAEKIPTLVKDANKDADSYRPGLFAKLAEQKNNAYLISNIGSSSAPVAVADSGGGEEHVVDLIPYDVV